MKKLVVFPNDPLKAYYEKGECKPRYFNPSNLFDEVHIMSLCDEEIEEAKVQQVAGNAKLKIHAVGSLPPVAYCRFFGYRSNVLKLVTQIEPDVTRAYNPLLAGYLAVFCARKLVIPSVLSLHGDYDEIRRFQRPASPMQKLQRFIIDKYLYEPYALKNVTRTICVTNFLVSYARKYGAKDVDVIYNRVYTQQFHRGAIPKASRARPQILCVGRLDLQKNQQCLIRAIKQLDVELTLIGDGSNHGNLKSLAEDLGISQKVHFIRSVPNQEINQFYWDADIFAIATRWEGFCIPVLEAMSSGLPVVVADKEPLPEVLGGTGIVVENTPEAFEEAFKRLLSDPQLRRELGEKAEKRALELDGEKMERKEVDLYKQLLEKP